MECKIRFNWVPKIIVIFYIKSQNHIYKQLTRVTLWII